ncbi:hypothetical protein [Paenibacillus thiaminolyticus]|uniref:hypothetical protein n=1 Tax=Paenibacillus thiaminolyticus TaxID=49283 RepID=UPI002543C4D1|nr:hypothetical protein [Paenibacillus thiaminolyticus]WII36808.1 hypothetical protein O0V01_24765 [Paenibacillus thiaminolyticus]
MANNTPNLELYKVDPITDGDKTFNVTTMLNENWDKIDRAAADWGNAKILPPMSYKASDEGSLYPKGMTMFWINSGKADGWPADNGQIVTWYLAQNRLSQIFFETDVRSLRMWLRRWSDNQKMWTDFLELETTNGSAQKAAQALEEAKAYTDEKTATIDAPVKAVNGKTGDVVLTADDVGAVPKTGNPTISGNLSVTQRVEAAFLQAESNGGLAGIIAAKGTTSAPKDVYVEFKTRGASGPRSGYIGLPNPAAPDDIVLHSDNGGISLSTPNKKVYINSVDVIGELNLVKQSVVEGKGLVAEVINGKGGGPVSAYNTFPELAAGINRISTGGILDYSNGERYTAQNEKWDVWMATVPAFKRSMSFRTNEKSEEYETGSTMETWYGLSYLQFLVVDSNNKEVEILTCSTDSSGADYRFIQSIEIDWGNTTEQMVVFYRTKRYERTFYNRIVTLPSDFNKNGPIRFKFRITHDTSQKPSEFRSWVSLRGRFLYV